MKCDKLQQVENPIEWGLYYDKNEVDAAISELKQVYKDSVDVKVKIWERCKKAEDELRKTQRSLWLARALALSRFDVDEYLRKHTHCNSRFWNNGFNTFNEACKQMQKAINIAEAKCRAKANEYK